MLKQIFKLTTMMSTIVIAMMTQANSIIVSTDAKQDSLVQPHHMVKFSDAIKQTTDKPRNRLNRILLPKTCHVKNPFAQKVGSLLESNTNFNAHWCAEIKKDLSPSLQSVKIKGLHKSCQDYKNSLDAFGLLDSISNPASIKQPVKCPTKNVVALCDAPTDRVFVYDTLLPNSNEQNACKQAQGIWLELPKKQRPSQTDNHKKPQTKLNACESINHSVHDIYKQTDKPDHVCIEKLTITSYQTTKSHNKRNVKPLDIQQTCVDVNIMLNAINHIAQNVTKGGPSTKTIATPEKTYFYLASHCPVKHKVASCIDTYEGAIMNFYGNISKAGINEEKQSCFDSDGVWLE